MSAPVKKPCFVTGTPRTSGDPQTGEIAVTRGGARNACVWSGSLLTNAALTGAHGAVQSGGHILLCSGPGRLNTVIAHQYMNSGLPVWFYDAGSIAPSGTSVSGQRIIGFVPHTMQTTLAVLSGNVQSTVAWNFVQNLDMPFTSGLCVGAASGTPGFTVSYVMETVEPAFGRDG